MSIPTTAERVHDAGEADLDVVTAEVRAAQQSEAAIGGDDLARDAARCGAVCAVPNADLCSS
ncbi:hypothetical protein OHA05_14170 [Streptomyces sp. NBC_00306]